MRLNSLFANHWRVCIFALLVCIHVVIVLNTITQAWGYVPLTDAAWLTPFSHNMIYTLGKGADFFSIYHAAHEYSTGQSIYGYSLVFNQDSPYFYSYRYLPFCAIIISYIFGSFDAITAYYIWISILEIMLVILTIYIYSKTKKNYGLILCAILLLAMPIMLEFFMGQFTLFVMLMTLFAYILYTKNKLVFASIIFALAVVWKHYPLMFLPLIYINFGKKAGNIALLMILGAILINIPYFFNYLGDIQKFIDYNLISPNAMVRGNYGGIFAIDFILNKYDINIMINWKLYFRILCMGFSLFWVIKYRYLFLDGALVLLCSFFICYPDIWEHHYSALIVLSVFWLATNQKKPIWLLGLVICFSLPTFFYCLDEFKNPLLDKNLEEWSLLKHFLDISLKILPVMGLFIFLVRQKSFQSEDHVKYPSA